MTTPEMCRWSQADERRDQLQAELDRLDAFENLDAGNRDDAERQRLDDKISEADQEAHDAQVAYWRSEDDDEQADRLESDRLHAELEATEAAASLMDPPDDAEGDD